MLLPMLVVQVPLTIANGVAWWILLIEAFPEAQIGSITSFVEDAPPELTLWIVMVSAGSTLFTLVGFAASIAAADSVLRAKPLSLVQSLDPGFTRMGGLLVLGLVFYAYLVASVALSVTIVGTVIVLYVVVRSGLAFPALVLDRQSPMGALRSSWNLLHGRMTQFLWVLVTLVP
jgi:hypothetical protein